MMKRNFAFLMLLGILLLSLLTDARTVQSAEGEGRTVHFAVKVSGETTDNSKILVELFLAQDHKGDIEAIKKEFASYGITKVRPQVFRIGHPPENIAIGPNIPADIARMTIRLAIQYNRGVKLILSEKRLAADYIAFGTSIFDESYQFPIKPEDLERLSDPKLTTAEFHALYRKLTGDDE